MRAPAAQPLLEKFEAALAAGTFVKLTLSQPGAAAEPDLRNLYGRLIEQRGARVLSLVFRYAKRDVTRNVPLGEAGEALAAQLCQNFERAHLFTTTGDWQWRADRPAQLKASRPAFRSASAEARPRKAAPARRLSPFSHAPRRD
jgi:hypothetical protein